MLSRASVGYYMHMWWFCPIIQPFWLNVYTSKIHIEMFLYNFKATPLVKVSVMAANLFTAASQVVAKTWKEEKSPSMEEWAQKTWHFFC